MPKAPFDFITTKTSHPLDKGWSWVIMIAAFGSQFIVIGYQRSFGLLFVAFQERYDYSSALLSFVNGTQSLTYSFSTMLVMNYLLKKISVRTSCLLGVCCQAAATMACSVFSDMFSLILCQGFLFGLGHSLLYCPTILILSLYFDRHRSIATAVATCGAGAGGIAFPYITRFLLNTFGLDGALLLLGALLFNQGVFYALYQPIVVEKDDSSVKPSSQPEEPISSAHSDLHPSEHKIPGITVLKNSEDLIGNSKEQNNANNAIKNQQSNIIYNHRAIDIFTKGKIGQLSSSQVLNPVVAKSLGDSFHLEGKNRLHSSHGMIPADHSRLNQSLSNRSRELLSMLGGSTNGMHCSLSEIMVPVNQREDGEKFSHFEPTSDVQNEDEYLSALENPEEVSADMLLGKEDCKVEPNKDSKDCIPAVMRLPAFWLVAVYTIGGIISAGCPAVYIPPLSKEKGLTHAQAAFFLTISATTDFIGRLGTGLILHFKLINPCSLALIALCLSTLFYNLTPILNDSVTLLLLVLQYGISSSMYWTLMSLVIIDVLGLVNLGPAMGFYAVISGVTTSASFPFAGWLRDETGTYSSSFHYFGAMSFVATLAILAILLTRYKAKSMARHFKR